MVYLKLRENSTQAKKMLDYLKTLPFIEVVEKEEVPNYLTRKAIMEADKGGLKRHKSVKSLMKELKD